MVTEEVLYDDGGNRVKVYSTEGQDWDDEALKELEDNYNVFYNPDCVTPIKVEGMDTNNPILYFGYEDDGWLTIGNEVVFSSYYLDALIDHLKLIKSKIEKNKNS